MSTRGSIIWGKDELTRAPAPDAEHIRRDFNSACAAAHLPPRETRLHGVRGKKDHASASAQPGSNTPPGLCGKLRSQGLAAKIMTLPYSFLPSLTETVTGLGFGLAVFWFLFV
jgi:hypothetical protein